jgi:hypothetical protein
MSPVSWLTIVAMWWTMMIGMMLPSAAPLVLLYGRVIRHAARADASRKIYAQTLLLLLGYLGVWLAFSIIANRAVTGRASVMAMQYYMSVTAMIFLAAATLAGHLSGLENFELSTPHWSVLARCAFIGLTATLIRECTTAYDAYEFHRVYQLCTQFCTVTLSATYHDILKDRLYTHATNSPLRRSSQTAIHHIFHALVRVMAPILTRLTAPFNLTGLPALSVPCGADSDGLPIGLQIVGAPWAERRVLRAGRAYERAVGA